MSRGIGSTCSYQSKPGNKKKVSVGDRIQQLESLVRSLAQQQQSPQQHSSEAHFASSDDPSIAFHGTLVPKISLQDLSAGTPLASVEDDNIVVAGRHPSLSHETDHALAPAPSEHGSMLLNSHGANYVGSFHWAAVLDSISELKDHYEEEEEARLLATSDHTLHKNPGPRLLYEPVQATKSDLLDAIPARRAVDRMVARYFSAHGIVPEILHRGHFLKEVRTIYPQPF